MQRTCSRFVLQLATNPRPAQLLNPLYLNDVLGKALQGSNSASSSAASCLSFRLIHMPHVLQPNGQCVAALPHFQSTFLLDTSRVVSLQLGPATCIHMPGDATQDAFRPSK